MTILIYPEDTSLDQLNECEYCGEECDGEFCDDNCRRGYFNDNYNIDR